jgi:cell wall-associated NlpC family hydrolase
VSKLRISRRVPIIAVMALVVLSAMGAPAYADPLSAKRAQAAAVQAQIDALDTRASVADEAYNSAHDKYAAVSAEVGVTERQIAALEARAQALQADLATRADQMYREGGDLGEVAALLSSRTFAEFDATLNALEAIGRQDASTVSQLKQTEADAQVARTALVAQQAEAAARQTEMSAAAAAVHQQLDERTRVLAGLSADIKALLAQEQARQAAEAHARYLALLARERANSGSSGGSGGSSDPGGNPPSSSQGAAAVHWAESALGRPYLWAASGPDRFDCSGLVMWAYDHVGVRLPHSSRAQIGYGSRVSKDNLQPGDLVFFGSPIHHVGMYVGGGDFIEAPGTGGHVQISTLGNRGDYAGACRP